MRVVKAMFAGILSAVLMTGCTVMVEPNAQNAASPPMADDGNIVQRIISAPYVPNGIVADEPTTINILLNAPGVDDKYFADPRYFGHQIPAGGRMEIELGGTFQRNGVDNDAEFVPFDGNFNLILIAGNPQNAIVAAAGSGMQHGNYTVEDNSDKIITVRPNGGSGKNGLEGARATEIGVKVLHLLPRRGSNTGPAPFQNGPAGTTGTVAIRIYGADGTLIESGDGSVDFPASVGRQIFPINFGLATPELFSPDVNVTDLVEATNFQHVAPGTQLVNTERGELFAENAPYALRFLLLEALEKQPDSFSPVVGVPNVGIAVDQEMPSTATLVQDVNEDGILDETDTVIGQVVISGPTVDSPGRILEIADWPLTASGDGVEGLPGSFVNVPVEVGSAPGTYAVTVSLDGGGEATLYVIADEIVRLPATTTDPNGYNVLEHCGGDFPLATAKIDIQQADGATSLKLTVIHAKPDTLFTAWLRLQGTTPGNDGVTFGGSPLTQAGSTPLAPTSDLANLLTAAQGPGSDQVANGFMTDSEGSGVLSVNLDFPLLGGAYPFNKYDASLPPVAITGAPLAPFMIRVVSHCTDHVGHGVNAGNREPWFDWSPAR